MAGAQLEDVAYPCCHSKVKSLPRLSKPLCGKGTAEKDEQTNGLLFMQCGVELGHAICTNIGSDSLLLLGKLKTPVAAVQIFTKSFATCETSSESFRLYFAEISLHRRLQFIWTSAHILLCKFVPGNSIRYCQVHN
uniref:Uncharacterized protein n=1 Tax=Arundo donax TaxID=35708 RepID=A0A0A8YQR8_ARUDO